MKINSSYFEQLYQLCDVPIVMYENQKKFFQIPTTFHSVFDQDTEYEYKLPDLVQGKEKMFIYAETESIFYGILSVKEITCVIGPVSTKLITEQILLQYRHKYKLIYPAIIKKMDPKRLTALMSVIGFGLNGEQWEADGVNLYYYDHALASWNVEMEYEKYELEQTELHLDHNSSRQENKLLDVIRNGNVAAMEKLLQGDNMVEEEHIGVVAENSVKRAEYLILSLITLASRAAAEGGLDREVSYSLSDLYMRKLEKCRTEKEMYELAAKAQLEFTEKVAEAKCKASKLRYIEQTKSYINRNLRKPIEVAQIADAIGMNRSYLTRRFTEEEGISIHKYIMKERCVHVANMLKYSDYSISLIADYFCFASQSHLGKVFREFYGMTPKEYRNLYQVSDDYP